MGKLLDEVMAGLPTRRGPAPWYERLDRKLLAEMEAIRSQWASGELKATKSALGKSLSKSLAARGVTINPAGVSEWLEKAKVSPQK
jgi:hypothetical protein